MIDITNMHADNLHSDIMYAISKNKRHNFKIRRGRNRVFDDDFMMGSAMNKTNEVLFGAYSLEEFIISSFKKSKVNAGASTLEVLSNWFVPSDFKLSDFLVNNFKTFTSCSDRSAIVHASEKGIHLISQAGPKIEVTLIGEPDFIKEATTFYAKHFTPVKNMVRWVYNSRGDDIQLPLNLRKLLNSAYPWIQQPVMKYIDDYLASQASVLILIGPPGTGKTTFIKNIIERSGTTARVAYDCKVLEDDGFFASFVESNDNIMVMEDSDAFLQPREDGNTMMHKFLNVSDGLISAPNKKIVFSTNLPKVSDIDPALLRTGRCFDTLHFRALTRKEAQAVIQEAGTGTLRDHDTMTLAEIFGQQPSGEKRGTSIGFI
jgi:hypothetical protein